MKTQIFTLLKTSIAIVFLLFFVNVKAQYVTIPDTNFVHFLQANYPACMSGNQLDTTCTQVLNETFLNVNSAGLYDATGIQYFKGLNHLDVHSNNLTILPALQGGITDFNCEQNMITSLPDLPGGLIYLSCSNNNLTFLPTVPSSVQQLSASSNNLISLPTLPASLTYLIVSHNQLTSLPALPPLISYFDCMHNNLTSIPALPPALVQLLSDYNALTSLPSLPGNLTYVSCTFNQLSSIPALPASLLSLYCDRNPLDSLPTLDAALQVLYCDNDSLTFLPTLNSSLQKLYCESNSISVLPALNNGLQELDCISNHISSISSFPVTLNTIRVDMNPIISLPALPPNIMMLTCSGDTNLYCLPRLTNIQTLDFVSTRITCIPNYIQTQNSAPDISTMPLCGDIGPMPGGCPGFWNIAGKTYFDSDNNCTFGGSDIAQQNVKMQLWSGGVLQQQAFTISGGLYDFQTGYGIFDVSVDTSNLPFTVSCPAGNLHTDTISSLDSLSLNNDFALICKPGFDVAAWSIACHRFVPGHFNPVNCSAGDVSAFYGAHCAAGISGTVVLQINGPAHYLSPDPNGLTPSYASADSIVWNVADYGAVNFANDFKVILQTDTTAVLGQTVCLTLTANPIPGDYNPANNITSNCYVIVSSYDPNEKQVSPVGDITPDQRWLTYTIQFQNTGTAPAGNIVVKDTLSSQVDPSTFQLLAYSYRPNVKIDGGVVYFAFANINLPDSNSDKAASQGYVQYKIKLKDNLPLGTQINNTAYIYFDYNAPVVTNTTVSTISLGTGIPSASDESDGLILKLFPNPAKDYVTVSTGENALGGFLQLTDVAGRTVLRERLQSATFNIQTSAMAAGVYFVKVYSLKGSGITRKLVIQ